MHASSLDAKRPLVSSVDHPLAGSKLLGHINIRATQIYAKIVDENKRKAVNLKPKL